MQSRSNFSRRFSFLFQSLFSKGIGQSFRVYCTTAYTPNSAHRSFTMNVPNKWDEYPACGVPIEGERIISFRTPLSKKFNCMIPDEKGKVRDERFTPKDVVANIVKKTGQNLLQVIDLTNTNRYYDPQMFMAKGVEYHKVKCEGHQIPSLIVYQRFKTLMDKFFGEHSEGLIGVHCTHGLNRTGYLVCRYLIEERHYLPHKAVHAFNKGRGCAMERTEYIRDLYSLGPSPRPVEYRNGTVDLQFIETWLEKSQTKVRHVDKERIIPFKMPLCKELFDNYEKETGRMISPHKRFMTGEVRRLVKPTKKSRSLVIDMSPYNNCYDPGKFSSVRIEYKKLQYPGSHIPDEDFITSVHKVITDFRSKEPEGLIGIHCIDGINLTGYVICRYLMDCRGYTAEKAFQAFFQARGYNIEDIDLLEKLKSLSPKTAPKNNLHCKRKREPSLTQSMPQEPPRRRFHSSSWGSQGYSFDYSGGGHLDPWSDSMHYRDTQLMDTQQDRSYSRGGSHSHVQFGNFSDYGQRSGYVPFANTDKAMDELQYRANRGDYNYIDPNMRRPGVWDIQDVEEHLMSGRQHGQYRANRGDYVYIDPYRHRPGVWDIRTVEEHLMSGRQYGHSL